MSQLGKLKAVVKDYEIKLNALQKLFMSDGVIDPQEQGILSEIETLIGRINQQLSNSVAAKGHKKEPQLEVASKESVNLNEERKALAEFVVDKEDVIEDPDGNIIFTPTGGPTLMWNNRNQKKDSKLYKGKAYVAIPGVILDNKGQEVIVRLVVSNDLYEAEGTEQVPDPKTAEKVNEKYDCTTNCTGLIFAKGKFVLRSQHVTDEFLENEGYKKASITNLDEVIKDDVGLYHDTDEEGIFVHHAEIATGKFVKLEDEQGAYLSPAVRSKGGVTDLKEGTLTKTWNSSYTEYSIYRREEGVGNLKIEQLNYEASEVVSENKKGKIDVSVSIKFGEAQDGIMIVTKEDFIKIKRGLTHE